MQFAEFNMAPRMGIWTHFCHMFSKAKYSLYINGELSFGSYINSPQLRVNFNGSVVLGQEQDELEGGFVETEIFRGKLAQYNIWSGEITLQQLVQMVMCRREHFGDILSTDVNEGVFSGASFEEVDLEDLCRNSLSFTVFPLNLNFFEAREFCRRAGSAMYAPNDAEENEGVFEGGQRFLDVCLYFVWIDVTDVDEEGVWSRSSGKKVTTTFFENEGANSPTVNCASMQKQKSTWYMVDCEFGEKRCLICEETGREFLTLRGLCFTEEHKRSFRVVGYKNKKPFFHGLYGYNIYFSPPGEWILHDVDKNVKVATLAVSSEDVYPIGLHEWLLVHPVCEQAKNGTRVLGLSVCDDSQFMCSNGDCVSRRSRCDNHDDCDDKSDEEACGTIVTEKNYRQHKPPQSDSRGRTLLLRANVTFVRFLNIEDTKNAITMEFEVKLFWRDSRLKFTNLVSTFSQIPAEERERLWRPELEFPNGESGEVRLLGEAVVVQRTGEPLQHDINEAKMGGARSQMGVVIDVYVCV